MKRRGFLGMLFGAPVAAVAGRAVAELPKAEPVPVVEPEEDVAGAYEYECDDSMCSAVVWDNNYATAVSAPYLAFGVKKRG